MTIGPRHPINSTILLVDYDPRWPSMFELQARQIQTALGDLALRIEHVGSTAVPGLCAKPIIDIYLEIADSSQEGSYVAALEAGGYILHIREPEWYEHRMFKSPGADVNLHCFSRDCPEFERVLGFRNRLRTNAADRLLYERTKRELAARTWRYVQDYADAKTEVIKEILTRI